METNQPGPQYQIGGLVLDLCRLAQYPNWNPPDGMGIAFAFRLMVDSALNVNAEKYGPKVVPLNRPALVP